MPYLIKTVHFDSTPGENRTFVEPQYPKKERLNLRTGDVVYIWCCETNGRDRRVPKGNGLSWRGVVIEASTFSEGRISVNVRLENQAPARCLGIANLNDPRASHNGTPISGLTWKSLRNSHKKIAELRNDESTFLDGFF